MQSTFHGAVGTVTGAMHLVEVNGQRVLLDCGLWQGRRADSYERNSTFPFDPRAIDAVVLSHAHIDHCGNLPNLLKQGFRGDIICTAATRDLAAVLLRDAADIQVSDIRFVNKIRVLNGEEPAEPLYTPPEAEAAIDRLVGVGYGRRTAVAPGIQVTFRDAGHILGSAVCLLELTENGRTVRLGYTGDLGRRQTPILRDPVTLTELDYLITESTYASHTHEPIADAESTITRLINAVCSRGGRVLIPSFAVGRTQELVYALHRQRLAGVLMDTPIYVDSPLALDATDVFRLHPECFDAETLAFMQQSDDPFGFRRLRYVRSVEESKRLNDADYPFVVIAASGMCESGRIVHHLRHGIGDEKNAVVIIGWQAPNTLGRKLQSGRKRVRERLQRPCRPRRSAVVDRPDGEHPKAGFHRSRRDTGGAGPGQALARQRRRACHGPQAGRHSRSTLGGASSPRARALVTARPSDVVEYMRIFADTLWRMKPPRRQEVGLAPGTGIASSQLVNAASVRPPWRSWRLGGSLFAAISKRLEYMYRS